MICRWIERHAEHTPEAPALRFEGERLTYAALARCIAAATGLLDDFGIGHGDRVAFLGENHPSQLVLLFACARLGAIQVPLDGRLGTPELHAILQDSGAAVIFATPELWPAAQEAAPPGCEVLEATMAWPGDGTGEARLPEGSAQHDDPLLLAYTRGATDRPQGAVLDHQALLFNALNSQHLHGLTAADRVLTVLPLCHAGGLNIQTTPALLTGAEVILHPRFEPTAFLAACARDRPSLTLLVPGAMQALVEHPGWAGAELSSLRAVGAGDSGVPLPLIEAFQARGVPVQQVYGTAETGPIALYQLREEALAAPGSIGRPALHGEARVVDAAGRPLPSGESGEIEVRGPQLARGYWNAPELTAAAWRGGWFATGDIGRMDAAGRFWFTSRRKDRIVLDNETSCSAGLEPLLYIAPSVAEGAAGEARGPGHFTGRLPRSPQPWTVVTVPELPQAALGTVRPAVPRRLAAGEDQPL